MPLRRAPAGCRLKPRLALRASELHPRSSGPAGAGHLVVKLWSTDEMPGPGEVGFFRTFAERVTCPLPKCLLAEIDPDAGRGVLVLEDLSHLEQGDRTKCLSLPPAHSLARGLPGLHGPWWDDPDLRTIPWLRTRPWAWEADWFADRRARFLARFDERLDGVTGPLLDRVEAPYAAAIDRLAAAPQTLLHGDVHLDNVLIDPATHEVVLLDWAMVAAVVVLFVTWTCAIARWAPATEREARIIDVGIARAVRAVHLLEDEITRFDEGA